MLLCRDSVVEVNNEDVPGPSTSPGGSQQRRLPYSAIVMCLPPVRKCPVEKEGGEREGEGKVGSENQAKEYSRACRTRQRMKRGS